MSLEKDKAIIYFPSIIFIVLATFVIIYAYRKKRNNTLKEANIVENYIPETSKLKQ